jgi:nitrogen fixation NifU-like protein
MDELYQEFILDHYKHPRNWGENKNADFIISESNASCGDAFTFYVTLGMSPEAIQTIKELKFTGVGCAISTAASSILTESLKGKSLQSITSLDLEYMQSLICVNISAGRHKCLLLPAKAMQKALHQ